MRIPTIVKLLTIVGITMSAFCYSKGLFIMKLVMQTLGTAEHFGDTETVKMLAKAGYDGIDYTITKFNDDQVFGQDYKTYAKSLATLASDCGVTFEQAHAPFPSSKGDAEYNDMAFSKIQYCIEFAALLGAKIIVVHPYQHLFFNGYAENQRVLKEMNTEFYSKLAEYGKQNGIKIATENMWRFSQNDNKKIIRSVCSDSDNFCDMIDSINSDYLTGCLDIGHTVLVDNDTSEMIHALGHDRLQALHIHDNNLIFDTHTLPYCGKIKWDSILKALAEIDYSGNFTYEHSNFIEGFPDELKYNAHVLSVEVGRNMISKIEQYKKELL